MGTIFTLKNLEIFLDEQISIEKRSAVIGVPHPDFGETPIALIVPNNGFHPDLKQIRKDIKKSFARYKHPRKIIVISELPRNTMGKVQKNF